MGEADTLLGQAIEVRRTDVQRTEAAEVTPAEVVREEEHHVGSALRAARRSRPERSLVGRSFEPAVPQPIDVSLHVSFPVSVIGGGVAVWSVVSRQSAGGGRRTMARMSLRRCANDGSALVSVCVRGAGRSTFTIVDTREGGELSTTTWSER